MLRSTPVLLILFIALAGCGRPAVGAGANVDAPVPAVEPGQARVELRTRDGRERSFAWSAADNLVRCRHYAGPEQGDYLWIRLAETPEADGDAGVRLDLDVCRIVYTPGSRLNWGPGRRVRQMSAGQHGSHCAATPGFAVWWHEGEAAFNSGPVDSGRGGDPSPCELELTVADGIARGAFTCAGLLAAPGEGATAATTTTGRELTLAAGSFACVIEPGGAAT